MANLNTLASMIVDIYNGGEPDSDSRVTIGQVEILCIQVAAWVRGQDFKQLYREFGVHQIEGKFIKDYTVTLTTGGTYWKKAVLPATYLALPNARGIDYVLETDSLCIIEYWPKAELAGLAGGISQSSGGYTWSPIGDYLEIRDSCNKRLPRLIRVSVGMIVPDESQVDEASDLIIMEKVLGILKGQPMPDKNINANPQ